MTPHAAPALDTATTPARRRARRFPTIARMSLAAGAVAFAAAAATPPGPHPAPLDAGGRVLAFERDGAVWVASVDGAGAVKVSDGVDPAISPDGRRVAFTQDTSGPKGVRRRIAIADVATRAVRVLASVPSSNAFGPVWSPDGASLLIYVLADKVWNLGLVRADDTAFRYVVQGGTGVFPCWSAAWAPDGTSILCHDLATLSRIALDGKPLWKARVAQLIPGGELNSGSGLSPSPDGAKLLVEADVNEPTLVASWDGPPPAVFLVDIAAGSARRVTEKGLLAWQPEWLDADTFLCVIERTGDAAPSVARLALAGGAPALVLANARRPTVSAAKAAASPSK